MHGWCTAARARRQLVLAASGAQLLRWYVWDAAGCWHLSVQHSSCTTTCGGITARGIRLATASSWPTTWPYPHAAAIWWLYHSCTVQARYTQHHSGYNKIAAMYPKSYTGVGGDTGADAMPPHSRARSGGLGAAPHQAAAPGSGAPSSPAVDVRGLNHDLLQLRRNAHRRRL